jgi:hypothetical protein
MEGPSSTSSMTAEEIAKVEPGKRAASARRRFIHAVSGLLSKEQAANLFSLFNQIALLPYEASESNGFLVLCRPDQQADMLPLIKFAVPFDVHDIRGVRKMLHISRDDLCVLCDGFSVYGLKAVSSNCSDRLIVRFGDGGIWELRQDGCLLVRVEAPVDEQAAIGLTEAGFISEVQRVFGELPLADLQHLWSLLAAAQRQSRGTNVLISGQAAAEAERLGSQCTRVRPAALTPWLMECLTSIDGTVILDPHGVCHAIGAILDGDATLRGDRTRGGRYNSALMYVDSSPFRSIVVVISQDGMVDLVFSTGPRCDA